MQLPAPIAAFGGLAIAEYTQLTTMLPEIGTQLAVHALKGTGIGAAAVCFLEIAYYTFQLFSPNHVMTLKDYGIKTATAIASNGMMVGTTIAGAWLGGKIGLVAGSTVGIVGSIIGFIIGLTVGGVATFFLRKYANSKCSNANTGLQYYNDVTLALKGWGFVVKDLDDSNIFNDKEIEKRFRRRALEAHPDRKCGSKEKWNELSAQYGILLALLEKQTNGKTKTTLKQDFKKWFRKKEKEPGSVSAQIE